MLPDTNIYLEMWSIFIIKFLLLSSILSLCSALNLSARLLNVTVAYSCMYVIIIIHIYIYICKYILIYINIYIEIEGCALIAALICAYLSRSLIIWEA